MKKQTIEWNYTSDKLPVTRYNILFIDADDVLFLGGFYKRGKYFYELDTGGCADRKFPIKEVGAWAYMEKPKL